MTCDDDNRLATFNGSSVTSDLDGNLTYAPLTNGTFVTQTFDARNRLTSSGGITNFYDAANNRIAQVYGTNTTAFVVNPNAKLPQVLMRIKNGVTNYYIYGAGLLYQITETAIATNTLTYHYDYRGSTIALSADNGLVTDQIEYSAYGLTTYRVGTSDTPFLFNGRYGVQTEPGGLLYMRARYYNPYLCRFLNPDPSGFAGELNFYAAFNGNPVSYQDPSGLGAVGDNKNLVSWLNNSSATPISLQGQVGTDQSFWNFETASTGVGGLGVAGGAVEFGSGTASIGSNLKFYTGFNGNQYVSVTKFSAVAKTTGPFLAGAGVLLDTYGVVNGDISSGKYAVNTGVTATGLLIGGPPGAAMVGEYYLIDNFYPGKWPGFLKDSQPASAALMNSIFIAPGF